MNKISEISDQPLKWEQPSALKMNYELRANDEVTGTLRFRSSFGSFATAKSPEGCWTFKRVGFWQTRVTIRRCDSDADIATFQNNTWSGGGTLQFPDGRIFRATTNFWQTRLEFQTESGSTLLQFQSAGILHLSATVQIPNGSAALPELPLLVMLGWYLIVMMNMDSSSMGPATSAG